MKQQIFSLLPLTLQQKGKYFSTMMTTLKNGRYNSPIYVSHSLNMVIYVEQRAILCGS